MTCYASVPPDPVAVRLHVEQFHSIDAHRSTFGVDAYLIATWLDTRLAYNSTTQFDSANPTVTRFSGQCYDSLVTINDMTKSDIDTARQIWVPDIYVEGQLSVEYLGGRSLEVYPNGTVEWSRHVRMMMRCDYRLDAFPYDTHQCQLKMGTYAQRAEDVQLMWAVDPFTPIRVSNFILNEFVVDLDGLGGPVIETHSARPQIEPMPRARLPPQTQSACPSPSRGGS
jgi:hypothetical protein